MARFTVRIELIDASWSQYEEMYKHLASQGMTDVIASGKGERYRLPPAEYNYEGSATRDQVLEMAKASAGKVVRSYRVLVTKAVARTWHNLESA